MIEEELPDELENDLDDIEPVGDESQLYEHFRDRKSTRLNSSHNRESRMPSSA